MLACITRTYVSVESIPFIATPSMCYARNNVMFSLEIRTDFVNQKKKTFMIFSIEKLRNLRILASQKFIKVFF